MFTCHCENLLIFQNFFSGDWAMPRLNAIILLIIGGIHVRFTETDAKASEDDLFIQVTVQVKGASDPQRHNFTLIAVPLTVAQYMAEPGKYGNSCHSIITPNIDPAEGESVQYKLEFSTLKDFTGAAMKTVSLDFLDYYGLTG